MIAEAPIKREYRAKVHEELKSSLHRPSGIVLIRLRDPKVLGEIL